MGYLVKYGNEVLFTPGDVDRAIHSARTSMRTDGASELSFTIPPTHPLRNSMSLHDFTHPVRVWFDSQLLFCGFVERMGQNMDTELVVNCLSDLAMLSWVHFRLNDHPQVNGNTRLYRASYIFSRLITFYNSMVADQSRQFLVGRNVGTEVGYYSSAVADTVVDVAATSPTTILDAISNSILKPYKCMLSVRYEGGLRYIDLDSSARGEPSQVIRFGENMTEFATEVDTGDMFTGCLPVGGSRRTYDPTGAKRLEITRWDYTQASGALWLKANYERIEFSKGDIIVIGDGEYQISVDLNGDGEPYINTYETLIVVEGRIGEVLPVGTPGYYYERGTASTASSLTLSRMGRETRTVGGVVYEVVGDIVYDRDMVAQYGLKTFTFSDSDIRYTEDLLSRAISELREVSSPTYTLNVDGVDMALYMSGYTHLVAGQKVRVVSAPHNVDVTMQVTAANFDLDNPGATKYTLGPVPKTATERIRGTRMETQDVRDMLLYDINDVITGSQIMELQ